MKVFPRRGKSIQFLCQIPHRKENFVVVDNGMSQSFLKILIFEEEIMVNRMIDD